MAFPSWIIPKCGMIPNLGWLGSGVCDRVPNFTIFHAFPMHTVYTVHVGLNTAVLCTVWGWASNCRVPPKCDQIFSGRRQSTQSFIWNKIQTLQSFRFRLTENYLQMVLWKLELNCLEEKCHLALFCNLYCKEERERCKALCQISSRQSNPTWGLESLFRESVQSDQISLISAGLTSQWYSDVVSEPISTSDK